MLLPTARKPPDDKRLRRMPIWLVVGALVSALLLLIFMILKLYGSPILDLPTQWLFVAAAPLIAGLLAGNYITRVKLSDLELEGGGAAQDLIARSAAIPESTPFAEEKTLNYAGRGELDAKPVQHVPDWANARNAEYARTRGYMLAHVYESSPIAGQDFNVSIFVVRHRKGTTVPPSAKLAEISSVEFFFGDSWGNRVFEVRDTDFFAVRTHAWGTFLASCRVHFRDEAQTPIVLFRYIDFSMAPEFARELLRR